MKLPQNLKFTKSQVDQYIRANDSYMKVIGIAGVLSITTAIIKMIQSYNDNKHEEKLYEHEEKMLELEIEKLKIDNRSNNE